MTTLAEEPTLKVSELSEAKQDLAAKAEAVRENAYAPYSRFKVGAALLGESGRIYVGCNVENGSYGGTICAERGAVMAAVAAGERRFEAIAITTTADTPCPPCGICRQVLAEFAPEMDVLLVVSDTQEVARFTLSELLPLRFRSEIFLDVDNT